MKNSKRFIKSFFKKYIKKYLLYLYSVRKYSPNTIKTYRLNLLESIKYINIEFDDEKYIIDLIPYRMKLVNKNKKTIYKKVSIFRGFISYLKDNNIDIVLKNDDNIKISKTLPKPLHLDYIKEALDVCDAEERLLIILLYAVGFRISEVSNLKIKDIENGWVRIYAKGGKIREVPLLDKVQYEIDRYIMQYEPTVYIFEKNRVKLSDNQLRYKLSKVFKKIGIKATPHQLRHSFATDLLNQGARISDVSELLGHSSLETTQIYTKLSSSIKLDNYKLAHPMCRE